MGSAGMDPAMGMEPGMSPEYDGAMDPGMAGDPYLGPGGMPGQRGGKQGNGPQVELINALVAALGVNNSGTAQGTLTQVVEGKFETDNNRAATLATLDTMVAHLCPGYEAVFLKCLTHPEELRELGKTGSVRRRGSSGSGEPGSDAYMQETLVDDMGSGGMYGAGRPAQAKVEPLTAEELQEHAFDAIALRASQEFRAKIAMHVANPATPQEDLDLFLPYLSEFHPHNVQAQMVLYFAPDTVESVKESIEDHFLAYSSDAMAGVLGIPEEERAEMAKRRESRRDRQRSHMGPGMEGSSEMAMDPGYMEETLEPDSGSMEGMDPAMPGMGPGGARRGTGSGRRSRYDTGRPSRYDAEAGPGQQATEPEPIEDPMADPDLPYRLASELWGAEMAKLVQSRLARVSSLENDAPFVLLASTLPLDSTRTALQTTLRDRWNDGPDGLETAGLFDQVISDPGFLVLVKSLKREAPEEPKRKIPKLSDMRRNRQGGGQNRGSGRTDTGSGPEAADMGSGAEMPGGGGRAQGKAKSPELAWMATA